MGVVDRRFVLAPKEEVEEEYKANIKQFKEDIETQKVRNDDGRKRGYPQRTREMRSARHSRKHSRRRDTYSLINGPTRTSAVRV